jgi:hypothetical protein
MDVLKSLLNSKKFWVLIIGLAVVLLNRLLDLGLTGDDLAVIAGADIAALVGVGMADFGKEAANTKASTLEWLADGMTEVEESDPTDAE